MESILLSIMVAILLVLTVIMGVVIATLTSRDKRREETLKYVLEETINKSFKHEKKKIAKLYIENEQIAQSLKELLKRDKLDVTSLATETERYAYALALKQAKEAVTLTEGGLERIRKEIRNTQDEIVKRAQSNAPGPYKSQNTALKRLYKQEKIAEKRVDSARQRLTLLTSSVSITELDEALESLGGAPAMVPPAELELDPATQAAEEEPVKPAELPIDPLAEY